MKLQPGELKHLAKVRREGRNCLIHKRTRAKLLILWAGGRAYMYSCGAPCYQAWAKSQGVWAEICWIRAI